MARSRLDNWGPLTKEWESVYDAVGMVMEIHEGRESPRRWQQQKAIPLSGPQETNDGTVSGRPAVWGEKHLVKECS